MWRSARQAFAKSPWSSHMRLHSLSRPPVQTNPVARHLVWGAAFTFGSFTVCAIAECRRFSQNLLEGRSWLDSKKFWDDIKKRPPHDQILLERDYEPVLDRIRRRINSASDSSKLLGMITLANIAVFGLWQIPAPGVRRFMSTLFVSDPLSRRLLPHLFSGFSHRTGFHLAFNMIALWSFGSPVCEAYGVEQFGFIYGSALVVSSIASHMYSVRVGRIKPSLGASGGVLGIVSMFTFLHPDRRLVLMFLPFVSFPAWAGLAGIATFDSVGLMLGWQTFDHAAHLGGMLFGYMYSAKLHQWTWDQRRKLTDALGVKPRSGR